MEDTNPHYFSTEPPTAGTMFDKLKFPLLIAFHLAFKISTKKKGMSSLELSEEYELRQKTCWKFKRKIQHAMKSRANIPLKDKYISMSSTLVAKRSKSEVDPKERSDWFRSLWKHCQERELAERMQERLRLLRQNL